MMHPPFAQASALLEALPYFQRLRGETVVIKYGGSAMEDPALVRSVLLDIVFLEAVGINPVVVHGGGRAITAAMAAQKLEARFVDGLRVTDAAAITIIDRVLTDVISPALAAQVCELGGRAETVSGKDVLIAQKGAPHVGGAGDKTDLGFVGDVTAVETGPILRLIEREVVPVVSPLGRGRDGQVYNINADTAAAQIARAIGARRIIYLSDVNGVRLDPADPGSIISSLNPARIAELKRDGVIAGGMIPKVDSALECLGAGVGKVHFLDGRESHALLLELFTDAGIGTEIAA